MALFTLRIEYIDVKRLSPTARPDSDVKYKANVSLSEKERNPGWITIDFAFDLLSQPEIAKIAIGGSVTIEGTRPETLQLLNSEDPRKAPPILSRTYEKLYPTLFLLCDAVQVPTPLPNLLKV